MQQDRALIKSKFVYASEKYPTAFQKCDRANMSTLFRV